MQLTYKKKGVFNDVFFYSLIVAADFVIYLYFDFINSNHLKYVAVTAKHVAMTTEHNTTLSVALAGVK